MRKCAERFVVTEDTFVIWLNCVPLSDLLRRWKAWGKKCEESKGEKRIRLAQEGEREFFFASCYRPTSVRTTLCLVNGQIAATLSHKRVQSAARGTSAINIELLSLAISVWFISQQESSISVGECSHGRCGQFFSFRFFPFLFFVRHGLRRRLLRRSLHMHERLRQYRGITRRDTSRTEIIVDKWFVLYDTASS